MDKPWIYSKLSPHGPSRAPLWRSSLSVCKWQLTDGDLGHGTKSRCLHLTDGVLPRSLTSAISEMGSGARLWLSLCWAGQAETWNVQISPPQPPLLPGRSLLRPRLWPLSSLPRLSWQKPGQVAPCWRALPCLCTFWWVGGAGRWPVVPPGEQDLSPHITRLQAKRISDPAVKAGSPGPPRLGRGGGRGHIAEPKPELQGEVARPRWEERAEGFS